MSLLFGYPTVGSDGTLFSLASTDLNQYSAYEYEPQEKMWIKRNEFGAGSHNSFTCVNVGNKENIWASTFDKEKNIPKLFRRSNEEDAWIEIDRPVDNLHTASPFVGADGTVWLLSMKLDGPEDKTLWRYTGEGLLWEKMPGGQEIWEIAVGDENHIYSIRNDGTGEIYKFENNQWVSQGGPPKCSMYQKLYLESIGVGNDGTIAVTGMCYNNPSDYKYVAWRSFDQGKNWKPFPLPEIQDYPLICVGGKDHILISQSGTNYRWSENQNKWELIPTNTIPLKDAIQKIQANLDSMIDLVDIYHNYFQTNVSELYTLCQVKDDDNGQQIANKIILKSFDAIGMIGELEGAGAISGVLSAAFNYMIQDGGYDWNTTFADIWTRLNDNSIYLRRQLSTINSDVVGNWNIKFVNPNSNTIITIADLVESAMPANHSIKFQKILDRMLIDGRYQLWKDVLPRRWDKVHLGNPTPISFKTESEVNDFIKNYIDKNANYYIIPEKNGEYWDIHEWWLGYGSFFPYNHHEAPGILCLRLFQDDGLGNIVRPNSITTRKDVFENWGLQNLTVFMPPSGVISNSQNADRLKEATTSGYSVILRSKYKSN